MTTHSKINNIVKFGLFHTKKKILLGIYTYTDEHGDSKHQLSVEDNNFFLTNDMNEALLAKDCQNDYFHCYKKSDLEIVEVTISID